MTKEELEKEAEEKFKVNNEDKDREHYYDRMWYKAGYLAGAKPREKRIEELEKLLEQMQDAKCISCTDLGGMLLKITDLEKKNTDLERKLEQTEKDLADYQFNYPKIKELEIGE